MYGVVSGNVGKIYKAEFVGQYFLLSFSIAEKVYKGGQKGTESCWHKVEVWGKKGEALAPYIQVGQHLDVVGQAYTEEYTSNDGGTGYNLVVKATDLVLSQGGKKEEPKIQIGSPPSTIKDEDIPGW